MFYGFDVDSIGKYDKHDKLYFYVTVRTFKNKLVWGRITDSNMVLSAYGKVAAKHIGHYESVHSAITVEESCIMPNHIHILLSIKRSGLEYDPGEIELKRFVAEMTEEYKQKVTYGLYEFLKSIASLGVSEDMTEFWHDGCNVKVISSLNEYGKASHHVKNNHSEWEKDKYYPISEM